MTRWLAICIALTLALTAAALWVGVVRTDLLRERIPTHWNIAMEPDAWTTREAYLTYLLIAPGIMALLTGLLWLLPLISPKNFEVERFAGTFGFALTIIIGFFGYMGGLLIWVGIEESPAFARCFVAGFFVLFALLGNVMGKVQRNFWMGVRTPWTLASDLVWDRTHRVTAWLWCAAGVLGAALVLAGVPFWFAFVLLTGSALWPAVYSLWLYKRLERQGKI